MSCSSDMREVERKESVVPDMGHRYENVKNVEKFKRKAEVVHEAQKDLETIKQPA